MNAASTRRTLLRGFLAGLFGEPFLRHASAAVLPGTGAERRALLRGFRCTESIERRYRAEAAVIVCGVTIFSRRGVGGAKACVELWSGESGQGAAALRFAAGSDPERCAGLNRFGILEEALIESQVDSQFAFAGLITDSKEENLNEAQEALRASGFPQVKLARGTASGGHVQTWTETVELRQSCTWKNSADLLAALTEQVPHCSAQEAPGGFEPFLTTIRKAALSVEAVTRRPFLHAGKLYSLELRRRGANEREGVIHGPSGVKLADFRVAYEAGDTSGLPVRIEYRAKPYLKLVFEAVGGAERLNVTSLFPKEAV